MTEYLVNWDGENFFTEILGLVKNIQITDFKELYDTVLSQLEKNFHNYPLIQKVNYIFCFIFNSAQDLVDFSKDSDPIMLLNTTDWDPAFNKI